LIKNPLAGIQTSAGARAGRNWSTVPVGRMFREVYTHWRANLSVEAAAASVYCRNHHDSEQGDDKQETNFLSFHSFPLEFVNWLDLPPWYAAKIRFLAFSALIGSQRLIAVSVGRGCRFFIPPSPPAQRHPP